MLQFLSGSFLLIGSILGGGILAIPIICVKLGILNTIFLLALSWCIMTTTGCYLLDLSISCPEQYNSYYSIVGKFLGNRIRNIVIILFLWLLYFSLSSDISGCVSLILSYLHPNPLFSYWTISLCLVGIFGSIIIISTKIIVRLNIILVIIKIGFLCTIIFCFSQKLNFPGKISLYNTHIFSFLLIIINAFGFQFIVPSLVSYYGKNNYRILKNMIVFSTSIVLCFYILWLITIYSIIPLDGEHGIIQIYKNHNQLLEFNTSLNYYLKKNWLIQFMTFFQIIGLFGSFFCVSLGIFDFLTDSLKTKNRLNIGILTLIPPLLLSLCSQNMYIYAMTGAGYIAIILEIIIPIWAKSKMLKSLSTLTCPNGHPLPIRERKF